MSQQLVLEVSGLRKVFKELVAVDDVSFAIAAGETYGLLGPNGAGKTTSISMACGILERDGGTVRVDGHDLTTSSTTAKAAIGLVPQDLAIYPDLTARENLMFFGRLYDMRAKPLKDRVGEVLAIIGLSDRADDRAGQFSGGMKRRLNIGIGLLHRPRLLVLDEPTVGVDPQSRNAILESVEHLSDEGMAVLYTTHYMEEAERLCDRVGIIDEGLIKAEGTRAQLVSMIGERDRVSLTAEGNIAAAVAALQAAPAVDRASAADGSIVLVVDGARRALPDLLRRASEAGADVTGVDVSEPNLEAVFLHLTGKALRD
ncbi:MAG: export ABC transporter ATP-binding protein [Actinobacteria bacterium RBG_16_67_15]|nr:MAG: export ABC transporter ATP-binding protein [Actinobacteria bacterium RBG_16_67_15]